MARSTDLSELPRQLHANLAPLMNRQETATFAAPGRNSQAQAVFCAQRARKGSINNLNHLSRSEIDSPTTLVFHQHG